MSAPLTVDLALAKIIIGYLSSTAALAGVAATDSTLALPALPPLDVMPRVTVYSNDNKTFPCLVVAGSLDPAGRDTRTVTVVIALNYKLLPAGTPTPREGYAEDMAAIELWLRSKTQLYAYIASLTTSEDPDTLALVTGWDLGRSPVCGIVGTDSIDRQNSTGLIPFSIKFFIRIPSPV